MKPETMRALLVARLLFERAEGLCTAEDRYLASAGLIALQDAVELVLYSVLLELGIDETRSIDNLSFPSLLGTVQAEVHARQWPRIPKTGTLKAMHEQRNTVKHQAQLVEPTTVRHFFTVATSSMDSLLLAVIGRPLRDILASDLLKSGPAHDHIQEALAAFTNARYYDALVAVRKAFFLEIEADYAVDEWRSLAPGDPQLSSIFTRRGHKSPWYSRGRDYAQQYVHTPFDFVILDHERVQLDLMAWGVPVQDFWNVWRLTPRVYRYADAQEWLVEHKVQAEAGATKENASYCIDRAISILLGKQRHQDAIRHVPWAPDHAVPVRLLRDQPLYEKASETSSQVRTLSQGDVYRADALIPGLDGTKYVHLLDFSTPKTYVIGYIPAVACEPIPGTSETAQQEEAGTG